MLPYLNSLTIGFRGTRTVGFALSIRIFCFQAGQLFTSFVANSIFLKTSSFVIIVSASTRNQYSPPLLEGCKGVGIAKVPKKPK